MSGSNSFRDQGVAAVLDTNVLLDIISIHDLFNEYENLPPGQVDTPKLVYRRVRARDAQLLAMALHRHQLATVSLDREPLAMLRSQVPTEAVEEFSRHFTTWFAAFVHPTLLPGWRMLKMDGSDAAIEGTACDKRLVEIAAEHELPLITNEGFTQNGVKAIKLRKRALAAGVVPMTPREFFSKLDFDEAAAIRTFGEQFDALSPAFVAAHVDPVVAAESFAVLGGALRLVLLGQTSDPAVWLKVTLP